MTNRRALVTGASRGLGAAIAKELAKAGHEVLLNYRSNDEAAEAVRAEIEAEGGRAQLLKFDVGDAEASRVALEGVLADGAIEILVNNAGIHDDAPFPGMSLESWNRVVRASLDGFFHVTQPLSLPMARNRWGRIISMSSVAGVMGNRGQVNYAAAKAGLHGASRSLAQELGKRGITVNVVAPGLIESDMTESLSEAAVSEAMRMVPMRRMGKATEVAKLVAFLASEDAAYITGQVIGINGGMA